MLSNFNRNDKKQLLAQFFKNILYWGFRVTLNLQNFKVAVMKTFILYDHQLNTRWTFARKHDIIFTREIFNYLRKSSAIFEKCSKPYNFGKSSENGRKSSENRQKRHY